MIIEDMQRRIEGGDVKQEKLDAIEVSRAAIFNCYCAKRMW